MTAPTFATDDIRYMRIALEEARAAADEGEIPIGAVIVCKGQIVARAHNRVERLNDPTAHAEMLAITMAVDAIGGKYLRDCTLYVTVEPCLMCAGALRWTQIPRTQSGLQAVHRSCTPSQMPRRRRYIGGRIGESDA